MEDSRKDKIVVVGASSKEESAGFKIFRDLIKADFCVDGVNPEGGEVSGKKIYRNLKELGYVPDLVITVVSPAVTEQIVDECKDLGIKRIWMQPGSNSLEAVKKAFGSGIFVIYNDCFMSRKGIWQG